MSETESQGSLSEDKVSQEEVGNMKMVPVAEAVRYHKRAQSAERRVEELAGELADVRAEESRLADELKGVQKEQELTRRLTAAGARDLEAATLIAKARLAGADKAGSTSSPQADLDGVVEQLKREKQYLFGEKVSGGAAVRTSGAKEQRGGGTGIERAAKRAAGTGSRADLQEYMRKRRSFV